MPKTKSQSPSHASNRRIPWTELHTLWLFINSNIGICQNWISRSTCPWLCIFNVETGREILKQRPVNRETIKISRWHQTLIYKYLYKVMYVCTTSLVQNNRTNLRSQHKARSESMRYFRPHNFPKEKNNPFWVKLFAGHYHFIKTKKNHYIK